MSTPALEEKRSEESEWKGVEKGRICCVVLLILARLTTIVSLWWFRAFFLCLFLFLSYASMNSSFLDCFVMQHSCVWFKRSDSFCSDISSVCMFLFIHAKSASGLGKAQRGRTLLLWGGGKTAKSPKEFNKQSRRQQKNDLLFWP